MVLETLLAMMVDGDSKCGQHAKADIFFGGAHATRHAAEAAARGHLPSGWSLGWSIMMVLRPSLLEGHECRRILLSDTGSTLHVANYGVQGEDRDCQSPRVLSLGRLPSPCVLLACAVPVLGEQDP